jgi:hypothetical protein
MAGHFSHFNGKPIMIPGRFSTLASTLAAVCYARFMAVTILGTARYYEGNLTILLVRLTMREPASDEGLKSTEGGN